MKHNKKIALVEIFILIIGIVAIGWAFGSEVKVVSAGTYPVKSGDYLNKICGGSHYGFSSTQSCVDAFVKENNLVDQDTIYAGSTLNIPSATNAASSTPAAASIPAGGGSNPFKGSEAANKVGVGLSSGRDKVTTGSEVGDWILKNTEMGVGTANAVGHIVSGFGWALGAMTTISMIGPLFGLDDSEANTLSKAAFWGTFVGKSTYGLVKEGGFLSGGKFGAFITDKFPGGAAGFSTTVGVTIALYYMYKNNKEYSKKIVQFNCIPWDAPTGGNNCEKCNDQDLPCSEYQCRSLGQACQLVNEEDSGEAKCVWVNRNDVNYPTIEPMEDALLEGYAYSPDNAISPPDRGVKVVSTQSSDGCVPAFTPLTFGISLDEPAKCKIDVVNKPSFDEMQEVYFSGGLLKYNHSIIMSLPGAELENETIEVGTGGDFQVYIRCQDANGNSNPANFVFKYCVDDGPDTTAPLIVTTDLLNGMPIAYNQSSVDIEVYVNEPSDCRWSRLDQNYENMENDMSCSNSVLDMNAQALYKCETILDGLKNDYDNEFYFRCKDQPNAPDNERNVNTQSYKFTIIGTIPLVIDSAEPDNETIKDATDSVKVTLEVETSAGYDEGDSTCYYSETDDDDDYIMFYYEEGTSSYKHSQDLYLYEGDYEYWIKCIDLGGNSDTEKIEFSVESDTNAPNVVRAYHEENYLKLITDETAECVYSDSDCSYTYDDGISLTTANDINHYTDWKTKTTYYIKCRDEYNNIPNPDECSIIVRPFDI